MCSWFWSDKVLFHIPLSPSKFASYFGNYNSKLSKIFQCKHLKGQLWPHVSDVFAYSCPEVSQKPDFGAKLSAKLSLSILHFLKLSATLSYWKFKENYRKIIVIEKISLIAHPYSSSRALVLRGKRWNLVPAESLMILPQWCWWCTGIWSCQRNSNFLWPLREAVLPACNVSDRVKSGGSR